MEKHFVMDLETLGTSGPNFQVIQYSLLEFNIENGDPIAEYNWYVDIYKNNDIVANADTLKFWISHTDVLLNIFDCCKKERFGKPEEEILRKIFQILHCEKHDGVGDDSFLWGNGILFDNRILYDKCFKYGIEYPIFFRNDQDVRTIFKLTMEKLGMTSRDINDFCSKKYGTGITHNAIDDCRHEARVISFCRNSLLSKE